MSTKKPNVVKKPTTKATTKPSQNKIKDDLESNRDRSKPRISETPLKKSVSKTSTSSRVSKVENTSKTLASKEIINKTKDSTGKIKSKESDVASKIKTVSSTGKISSQIKETPKVAATKKVSSISSTKKAAAPKSPSSTRVTKSQFYPNKNMYSNALKDADIAVPKARKTEPTKPSTRKTISKVVKDPSAELRAQIATARKEAEVASSNNSLINAIERPRTATLRKGSIVNMNIAGPDITKERARELSSLDLKRKNNDLEDAKSLASDGLESLGEMKEPNLEYDYEDDFNSYESDFEEYVSSDKTGGRSSKSSLNSSKYDAETNGEITSSSSSEEESEVKDKQVSEKPDEERNVDSGNFDMPENKHKPILDNINEIVEKDVVVSSSDEGFEESSLQYINFLGAVKKCEIKQPDQKNKRGQDLMNMIQLNTQNFTIFELAPVTYDKFIKSFGNRNSIQVTSQTGDDDISEECQTDAIDLINKWTQFPTKFTKISETDDFYLQKYRHEYLGVGGDQIDSQIDEKYTISYNDLNVLKNEQNKLLTYNENHLKKFIESAGQVILNLMQESSFLAKEIVANDQKVPFSDGYIPLNTQFLKDRPILCVSFSSDVYSKVLSIHGSKKSNPIEDNDDAEIGFDFCSLGCVWTLNNPSQPEDVFYTFGNVVTSCFGLDNCNLIFGGLNDGTISIWDLHQNPTINKHINITPNTQLQIKPTCFTTAINMDYCNKIVSLQSCYDYYDNITNENYKATLQLITLNDVGNILIWGLLSKPALFGNVMKPDELSLVLNFAITLPSLYPELNELECFELVNNVQEPNHIYISTNYGVILHCLSNGAHINPRKFTPDTLCSTKCTISTSSHAPEIFFVGYENGNISLFTRQQERPLLTMCDDDNCKIDIIEWSQSKPCLFYVKDNKNNIKIWDLTISEMVPIYTVPFIEQIDFLKLSPINYKDTKWKRLYMIIVTSNQEMCLHVLNKEHGQQKSDIYASDMKTFLNYVKRL